jgi:uncharacterized membrane protein YbhN (UPF0104 family)
VQQSLSDGRKEELGLPQLGRVTQGKLRSRNLAILLLVLKVVAGIILLYLSARGIRSAELVAAIRSAGLAWLGLALLSVLLGLALKLWRWAVLLKNYRLSVSFANLFAAYFAGQAANILLPFRGGELVRLGYFTPQKESLPQVATTIVLEKYLDLLALALLSLLVSFRLAAINLLDLQPVLLPVTITTSVILLVAILFGPALWGRVRGKKYIPQVIVPWLDRWLQASRWLLKPMQVLPAVLLTLLIWVVMWLTNLLLFRSLGLSLGGDAAGLVLALVYIGLLPALMPGNIGPFYFFASLAVLPFGILSGQALAFAVLLHAIVTLPPLLGGAAGLFLHSSQAVRP